MKSRVVLMTLAVLVGGLFLLSMTSMQQQKAKPWKVPDNYLKMKNPAKNDAATINAAKALWNKHCKSCHGAKGLGDGTKTATLKTFPGDFSSAAFQGLSDGELYYKTTTGRDEMPSYQKNIPDDDDRWALVHFMRTLKK